MFHRSAQIIFGLWLALSVLAAQVSGLHHHPSPDRAGADHHHTGHVHFEDAGLHHAGDEPEAAHHGHQPLTPHLHADVEVKVLDSGLLKLPLAPGQVLMAISVLLFSLSLRATVHGFTRFERPPKPARRYVLSPPSHAPPLTVVAAV